MGNTDKPSKIIDSPEVGNLPLRLIAVGIEIQITNQAVLGLGKKTLPVIQPGHIAEAIDFIPLWMNQQLAILIENERITAIAIFERRDIGLDVVNIEQVLEFVTVDRHRNKPVQRFEIGHVHRLGSRLGLIWILPLVFQITGLQSHLFLNKRKLGNVAPLHGLVGMQDDGPPDCRCNRRSRIHRWPDAQETVAQPP